MVPTCVCCPVWHCHKQLIALRPNLDGNHKQYLYGAGSILVAHSDHEHLKIEDLEEAVKDYKKIILSTLS